MGGGVQGFTAVCRYAVRRREERGRIIQDILPTAV